MLVWEGYSGHLCMGFIRIKEAQGEWLSPVSFSLHGHLSLWGPSSGQEFDCRGCSFHSWMQPSGADEAGGTLLQDLVAEKRARVVAGAGVGASPAQPTLSAVSLLPCLSLTPTLFSLCRTTSLSLTSQTPAATPPPRRPLRPPRQHPLSLLVPRRLLPYTLPRSAHGSRRTSTCQVPPCLGRHGVCSIGGAKIREGVGSRQSPDTASLCWKAMD